MKRLLLVIFCIATLFFGMGKAYNGSLKAPITAMQNPGKKMFLDPDFGNIGLYFITNEGQVNKEARFYARTSNYTLWVTKQGLVFDSFKNIEGKVRKSERDVSRLIFLNARKNPEIVPEKATGYRVNYFKGNNPSGWNAQIPSSERVCYQNLYNNIDLKIYGVEKEIEYDWIIKPGGNPSDILFDYQQIKKSFIDPTGNLVIQTAFGEWLHKKPVGYQVINGKRLPVEIDFIKVKKEKAAHLYGFKVSPYDKNHELIIDPMVIAFSTYLGGNSWEKLNKIVLHNGSIYATGYTDSANFPTMNAIQDTMAGSSDAFITQYSADGSSLVYSTYLGGNSDECALAIDVDNNGNVYITGFTDSSDFPTVSPYQNVLGGSGDAFITKISADGSSLLYSTYLGGSNFDEASDIFVNSSSEIYVAGKTFSSNFPLLNALQSNFNGGLATGNMDAFITKLSDSGSSLVFSTYLGGSGDDHAKSLDIDNYGNIYAGGYTYSSDFPVYNGYQMFIGSQNYSDGFLTKITPDGSALTFSTYLGGDSSDEISDIDTDTTGIYVTGETWSYYFPTTANAYQTTMPGDAAAFISKFNLSGSSLFYSSFLGGSGTTRANGIVANPDGSAYIVGRTNSSNFPQMDPVQYITISGNNVAFITRFLSDGTDIDFSSAFGSGVFAEARGIQVDTGGNIYLGGTTGSGFPIYNAVQPNYGGSDYDGFVMKLETAHIDVISPNGNETFSANSTQTIQWSAPIITDIAIRYSTDNGQNWTSITASTPNTGSYEWLVPYVDSNSCLISITDASEPPLFSGDTSDAVFSITTSPLLVTSPNGGESWETNTSQAITWASTSGINTVRIEYSTDNGNSWNVFTASAPNTGSYNWTVPYASSADCLVKVSDTGGPAFDQSNDVFTIILPRTITITSPNGGEGWDANTVRPITWDSTGAINNVRIEYSTDNGNSWNLVTASTANTGSYNWTIPDTPSSNCLVKVNDIDSPAVDQSDAIFTILPYQTITVTSPNGGEYWEVNSVYPITWDSTGAISTVRIEYSTDNGNSWNIITASTAKPGSYNWTVPDTPSSNCLVKISDTAGPAFDQSNAVFTILPAPSITVTTPNGGQAWEGNTVRQVTWTSTGSISSVKIEYSTNNGSSWDIVINSTPNTGTYNWTVPNTPSNNCLIKISDTSGPAVDVSDAVFSIITPRTITVTSPNGGENLLSYTTYAITWTSTGNIPNVFIQYTDNNGSTWNTIAASTANTGTYNWTIPFVCSSNCLVKISDTSGPAFDQSDNFFTTSCATYCPSSGTSQSRGYISQVQVGSLNNSSGSSGYTDFTSLIANMTRGASVNVNLTASTSMYIGYWKIWIDYNRDGDFDDTGENVFSGSSRQSVSGSFTVSSGTNKGTARMRISMKSYNNYPLPCETINYGEVEDYTVNIL